jgi:hypothetical protein
MAPRVSDIRSKYLAWPILAITLLAIIIVLAKLLPPAFDLHTYFYPGVRDWLDGGLIDADWSDWFYTPWVLIYFAPFALLPEPYARSAFLVFAVVVTLWTTRNIAYRRLAQVLILISFPLLGVYWEGALEPYSILGIGLCVLAVRERRPWIFSVGFPLLFAKPQETLLAGIFLIWSIRKWKSHELFKASIGPIMMMSAGLLLFDLSWVSKVLHATGEHHGSWVNISVWWRFGPFWLSSMTSLLVAALGVWLTTRIPFGEYSLALVVAFGLIASPYVATHHLALPMVLSWPWLFGRNVKIGGLVYLSTLSALLRLGGDQGLNWLDFMFPIILILSLLGYYRSESKR